MARAMVVNATQLATYSQAKQLLTAHRRCFFVFGFLFISPHPQSRDHKKYASAPFDLSILFFRLLSSSVVNIEDGIPLHFGSSMISGLATTAASMPVDIVKTRIQNMRIVNGIPEYTVSLFFEKMSRRWNEPKKKK